MQNPGMKQIYKWFLFAGLLLAVLLSIVLVLVQHWFGTDDFKALVEREAETVLGVAVQLERIDVTLWPQPAVALEGLQVQTQPALTLEHLEVRPAWSALMLGRLELSAVVVRRAVLAQSALDALFLALQRKKQATQVEHGLEPENIEYMRYIPRRLLLENVTWLSLKNTSVALDLDAQLSPQGFPDEVSIKVLQGQWQGAAARLERQGNDWTLAMTLGAGTLTGHFELQPAARPGAQFVIKGQLKTRALEVAALSTAPQPILTGRLDADTTLTLHTSSLGGLVDGLQTKSKFTVHQAVLHGLDLAKAVKTIGLSRGGQTPLDTLGGQVSTHGRGVQLSNLAASSGVLSATGNVMIAPSRALSGRISVDLAATALGGAVGVPLVVGGTLEAPEVTLTRGALIGAAIGTAILPGVGTGAGASVGDKLDQGIKKLFGR